MEDKIRLIYLDEEDSWLSQAHAVLSNDFDFYVPEELPKNIEDLWNVLHEFGPQVALIDYRLNDSGIISYTGDEVAAELHRHNKHFPVIIITSYEDNALMECKEVQIIRGKELLIDQSQISKLKSIIKTAVNQYNARKVLAESVILGTQEKLSKGEKLTDNEVTSKFDAELYLSELDLDSNIRAQMITNQSDRTLDEMLSVAREILEMHK